MPKRLVIDLSGDEPTTETVDMTPDEVADRQKAQQEFNAERQRRERKEQRAARAAARAQAHDFTELLRAVNTSELTNDVKLILRTIIENQADIMNLLGVSDYDPED